MQTVWLEFRHENGAIAANGTDVTFYIDGRWSWATVVEKIHDRIAELRETYPKYQKQEFVGITYSQLPFYNGSGGAIHTMRDPKPPAWAVSPTS